MKRKWFISNLFVGSGVTDDMRAEEQECGKSAEIVWRQLSLPLKFAFMGYKGTTEGNFPAILLMRSWGKILPSQKSMANIY